MSAVTATKPRAAAAAHEDLIPRYRRDPCNALPWWPPAEASPDDPENPATVCYLDEPRAHGLIRVRGPW
jgi:hypothetical protein